MGLRCLLGHEFSEPEIEREREETGEEAVTTVREVKTCARCGETRIVSENTEVTTIEQLADQATTAAASTESRVAETAPTEPTPDSGDTEAPAAGSGDTGAPAVGSGDRPSGYSAGDRDADPSTAPAFDDPDTDDAEILDETPRSSVGPDAGDTATPADAADAGDAATPADAGDATTPTDAGDAATPTDATADESRADDGAELIDDGPASARGEPTGRADSPAGADSDRHGFDGAADGAEDANDGVILDDADEAAPDADGERARGAWPAVEDPDPTESASAPTAWPEQRGSDEGFSAGSEEAADAEPEYIETPDRDVTGAAGSDTGSEIIDGETPDTGRSSARATTEYYCPECGMSAASEGNSMRAGDICPECKRGYVAERSR